MSEMPSTSQVDGSTVTVTVSLDETDHSTQDTVRLKLKKPKTRKKVNWTEETVDNENMGKKKSKCCCIYQKPKAFDESSSEDDADECENCHGHVELKKVPLDKAQSNSPESPQEMVMA